MSDSFQVLPTAPVVGVRRCFPLALRRLLLDVLSLQSARCGEIVELLVSHLEQPPIALVEFLGGVFRDPHGLSLSYAY